MEAHKLLDRPSLEHRNLRKALTLAGANAVWLRRQKRPRAFKDQPLWLTWSGGERHSTLPSRRVLAMSQGGALAFIRDRPAHALASDEQREQFRSLADQWERETEFESSPNRAAMHPAYQRIIGLGPAVIPLLLERLQDDPGHWFWALAATSGEDPATGATTLGEARRAWLRWGRERGYID